MKQRQLYDTYPSLFTPNQQSIIEKSKTGPRISAQSKNPPEKHRMYPDDDTKDDLYKSIKPLIVLGRIIMLIPCSKSNHCTYKQLKPSVSLLPLFANVIMTAWTLIDALISLKLVIQVGGGSSIGAMGYVARSYFLMNCLMEFIMYIYFLLRSNKFYRIFDNWSEMAEKINMADDRNLKYLGYILLLVLIAPLLVFATFMTDSFYQNSFTNTTANTPNVADSVSALERYFNKVLFAWEDVIPYSPVFVVINSVLQLVSFCARMFPPLIIIFFSRALSFQFRKLVETAASTTDISEAHCGDMRNKGKAFWIDLVKKHRGLVFLVRTVNNFLSPIIFAWVVLNIYNLSMALFRALSDHDRWDIPVYFFTISFSVDLILFMVAIISAAQVNKNAERILVVLRNCPKEDFYDTEASRIEHEVATGPSIGFSGLGCFVINNPFLIKVFNAVFTLEMIMLQSTPNHGTSTK